MFINVLNQIGKAFNHQLRRRPFSTELSTVDLFHGTSAAKTVVQGFSDNGFLINNIFVRGTQLLLPYACFHWDVLSLEDIVPESLVILDHTEFPLDLFIMGTGQDLIAPPPVVMEVFQNKGIALEVMSTRNAIGTFNTLNQEDRRVAAALFCTYPTSPKSNSYTKSSFS